MDALDKSLVTLKATGSDAGDVRSKALDRALDTAKTERAVQAVIDRWKALGEQGRVTGDQLTEGLERARRKLDADADPASSRPPPPRASGVGNENRPLRPGVS